MPESTPDDPFADLFGKLSDARARSAGPDGAHHGGPGQAAPAENAAVTGEGAPLTRRAAREAARRSETGETPAARETPVTPEASVARETPVPDEAPITDETPRRADADDIRDDDPLVFAEAAPALPYSRAGATAVAGLPTTTAAPAVTRAPEATAAAVRDESAPARVTPTLDDLFSGGRSIDDLGHVPPPPDKRRRRITGWIVLGVILVILGGIAGGGWYVWTTYEDQIREVLGWEEPKDYEAGLANGEALVRIASGDTGQPISQSLYDAGVTKTPEAFYDYLIDTGQNPNFQPGVYRLQKQMTSEAALAMLMDPANKMELTAQIPEGLTVDGTIERLAEGTGIPIEEFQAAVADPAAYGVAADSLEGWLFPATYIFDPDVTAQSAIQTLVDRTIQSLDAAQVPVEDRQRILTIASIIQREARYEADMQKVSRVIQNRLDPGNQETFGLLQMDSTAQYGIGEDDGTVSSSEEALTDDNPWNTYVHPGLPIGPISNPGDVAIDAAMHPAEGDWLYFVTVNLHTGETVFTNNLDDHNAAVEQWQQWCSDTPDSGC